MNTKIKLSSGKIVEMRPITAREQMNADSCGKGNPVVGGYYRTAMSIASIDEVPVPPASTDLQLDAVLERFTGRDIDELAEVYAQIFKPNAEILKND